MFSWDPPWPAHGEHLVGAVAHDGDPPGPGGWRELDAHAARHLVAHAGEAYSTWYCSGLRACHRASGGRRALEPAALMTSRPPPP